MKCVMLSGGSHQSIVRISTTIWSKFYNSQPCCQYYTDVHFQYDLSIIAVSFGSSKYLLKETEYIVLKQYYLLPGTYYDDRVD